MKALFLAASVAINIVLLAAFALQPSLAPALLRGFIGRHLGTAAAAPAATANPSPAAAPRVDATSPKLWSTLSADDLPALIARLRAAGFPAALIRDVVNGLVNARYNARTRVLQAPDPSVPFWKRPATAFGAVDPRQEQVLALQRERTRMLRDLFKDPFFASATPAAAPTGVYAGLTVAQRESLERIEEDYAEMISGVRAQTGGVVLPADRAQLDLLNREKRADLAAILSPAELEEYEMRRSSTTSMLRSRLTTFDATEAEFRAIYQAQLAVNAKFPDMILSVSSLNLTQAQRESAAQAFGDQLRVSLGEARYADYLAATNSDYQLLKRTVEQEKLPASTTQQVHDLRSALEREANRIADDPALNPDQKRAALQQLAQNTRQQITSALGPTASAAYLRSAGSVLDNVERGMVPTSSNLPALTIVTDNGSIGFGSGPSYRAIPNPRPNPVNPAAP